MNNEWHTHSINTVECFAYRGFFTIVLDKDVPVAVPRLRGMAHVGNLIRVPKGEVKKSLRLGFFITVSGEESFSLPEESVREIRDADGELICVQRKRKPSAALLRRGEGRHFHRNNGKKSVASG